MPDLTERHSAIRLALNGVAALVACAIFSAPAVAAPVTPTSETRCGGSLAKDPAATPTSDDPNLIDYRIYCTTPFTAYTVIANRRLWDFDTIDDFSSDVSVVQTDGNPSGTESVTCAATLPGDGINCNVGAGGAISAYFMVEGSFDLTDPYCKSIPTGSKPGTLATPEAVIQVVVTDDTGAQDGPFRYTLNTACPKVPDRVPFPPKKPKKPKPKKKSTHKKVTHKG